MPFSSRPEYARQDALLNHEPCKCRLPRQRPQPGEPGQSRRSAAPGVRDEVPGASRLRTTETGSQHGSLSLDVVRSHGGAPRISVLGTVHPQQAADTASVTPPGARESLSPSTLSVGCTASSPEQALEVWRPSVAGHEHDRGRAREPRDLIGTTEKTRGPPPSSHRTTNVAARDHVVSLSRRRNGCLARWPSRAMTSGRRRSLVEVRSPNQMSHEALRSRQIVSRDGSPPWAPVLPPTALSSFLPRGRGRRATPWSSLPGAGRTSHDCAVVGVSRPPPRSPREP